MAGGPRRWPASVSLGTQAPLLLTWLVLDRFPRRWFTPVLVGAMLAWGDIADRLVLLIGVATLAGVSALRAYQALVQRRGGLRGAWYDLSLLAAAGAAPGPYEFDQAWYDPMRHDASFVVLMNPPAPLDEIATWEIRDVFGRPSKVYDFGPYVIMTYDTNLLTDLSPSLPPPPPPGQSPPAPRPVSLGGHALAVRPSSSAAALALAREAP